MLEVLNTRVSTSNTTRRVPASSTYAMTLTANASELQGEKKVTKTREIETYLWNSRRKSRGGIGTETISFWTRDLARHLNSVRRGDAQKRHGFTLDVLDHLRNLAVRVG